MFEWNAIIPAGGRASRLGGIDKCTLVVRGGTLLDSALAATEAAHTCVVVGPERQGLPTRVRLVVDDPPQAGVPSAVENGLENLAASPIEFVAVLAADQPRADEAFPFLLNEVRPQSGFDAWVASDTRGREHPMLGIYRASALTRAIREERAEHGTLGGKLHGLLPRLRVRPVPLLGYLCADIDTPIDLVEQGIDPASVVPSAGT